MNNHSNISSKLSLGQNKKDALTYLAQKAREAHNDSDGILVNQICTVAISKINSWIDQGYKIEISFYHWALIFPLYWLIDDFILDKIKDIRKLIKPKSKKEIDFFTIYDEAFYLIEQCLRNCSYIAILENRFNQDCQSIKKIIWFSV